MNVLFVSSGNSKYGIIPFIKAQGDSLERNNINIKYFTIQGKGFRGYFRSIIPLKKYIRNNTIDIIHAHYSLCGWVTKIAAPRFPLVVSFMGTDVYGDYNNKGKVKFLSLFYVILSRILEFFVKKSIVKSEEMKSFMLLKKKVSVVPNGVNLEMFQSIDKKKARKYLGLNPNNKYVLFLGDKLNERKNYKLLDMAIELLAEENISITILNPYPVAHNLVPFYLNASDLLVLPSYKEGSPNVIKEAMACNCPIVATDVGDVRWLVEGVNGCFITSFDFKDLAMQMKKALKYSEANLKSDGRVRLVEIGLDSISVAKKIVAIYNMV